MNLSLSFDDKAILKNINLELQQGELVALCGPNAAGKSTLLAALAGEHKSVASAVSYFGQDASTMSSAQLARLRVVLEQSPELSADFSLGELLELGVPGEISPDAVHRFRTRVLRELSFDDMIEESVQAMSGGQQLRAHLGRVLMQLYSNLSKQHRAYLFLDEPTASLDLKFQIQTLQLLQQLRDAEGIGVLVVLHDLNLAASFADKICLMKDGRIVHEGTAEQVLTAEIVSDLYQTPLFVDVTSFGQRIVLPKILG